MIDARPNRRASEDLHDFSVRAFTRLGALVQPAGESLLEAVLPAPLAERLGRSEFLLLDSGPLVPSETPVRPDGVLSLSKELGPSARIAAKPQADEERGPERLAFGAPLLDRLFEALAESTLPIGEAEISDGAHAPVSAAESHVRENLVPHNASVRGVTGRPSRSDLIVLSYRYQAQCEDTADGLVEVTLDALSATPIQIRLRFEQLLRDARPRRAAGPLSGIERLEARARELVQTAVEERLAEFRADIERRRFQDAARLRRYYSELLQDLRQRRTGRLDAAAVEASVKKQEATRNEYAVKCRELHLRSRIEVRVQLVAALRVAIPSVLVDMDLLRRKSARTVTSRFLPALRELIRPECGVCGRPCAQLWMCDEGHVLCGEPGCYGPCSGCEKRDCPMCTPRSACRRCGRPRPGAGSQKG